MTSLKPDAVLLTSLRGREALSQLFEFELELIAPRERPVDFGSVIGQPAAVELALPGGQSRHFHGLVNRLSQGRRDETFNYYRATLVPQLWLLTRRARSRIFQHKSVPDILKEVLAGLTVTWDLRGTFHARDYCVQYRESDFAFASRLMEEEGIFYFFKHSENAHELVVANSPLGHPEVPVAAKLLYEEATGGNRPEGRVRGWEKAQELRSVTVTLWDHCFELPGQRLDAQRKLPDSVKIGKVEHRLQLNGTTEGLELYDYPGGYADRFDGVSPGGGDRADDLAKIFEDNARTAGIRLEQEAVEALTARGSSDCGQLTAGHTFALARHFNADGDYLLAEVEHSAAVGPNYRSGEGEVLKYENRFTCIPCAVPFRPQRHTPRPVVPGTQTATVTGPAGEEIFTDKYGRVKVQFHWDREGRFDADSSCWVRVATTWAGKGFGMIHIPRVGQEVVVGFLEGDPDKPIVVGSVYNAGQKPAPGLPAKKMVSGFKSCSTPGGGGFNELSFDDTKGKEKINLHAQYDHIEKVGHDHTVTVDNDEVTTVKGKRTETVEKKESITVKDGREETVTGGEMVTIHDSRTHVIDGGETLTVKGGRTKRVEGEEKLTVTTAQTEEVGTDRKITVKANDTLTVTGTEKIHVTGAVEIVSPTSIKLAVGDSSILIEPGQITLHTAGTVKVGGDTSVETVGGKIVAQAGGEHEIKGSTVMLNC